jgi:hypothetical protein
MSVQLERGVGLSRARYHGAGRGRIRLSAAIPLIPLEIPLQVPLQFRCSIPQGRGRKPLKAVVFCRWNQFDGRFLREFSAACRGIRAGFGYDPEPADPLTEVSDE